MKRCIFPFKSHGFRGKWGGKGGGGWTRLRTPSIQGGPKRMQRLWYVLSTTFLIECHWFLLYWIEYSFPSNWHQVHQVWIRRFDSRAIFLRQCRFQNVLLFPPQAGLKQRDFFNLTASHCVDKSIIALTLKRRTRQHEWNRGIHYATLWHFHWDSATRLRNEWLGFIHIVFLFKVRAIRGAIMLLSSQLIQWDAVRWKNPAASSLLAGESSTFWKWHCLRKIALESKRAELGI